MNLKLYSLLFLSFSLSCSVEKTDFVKYVNPFIGTKGEGNIFPGACLPYGMVKLGPDCGNKITNSGFIPDEPINGFSHTHVSGTGGGPKYGNILVMPFNGDIRLGDMSSQPDNYSASPGYFSVNLERHRIKAELSASHSVGFHKYTFIDSIKKGILIDAGSFLGSGF
jgi:putative alpha-1,2-mannosidase